MLSIYIPCFFSLACHDSISKESNQKCREDESNQAKTFYSLRTVKQRYHDYYYAFVSVEKTRKVIVILIEDETMRRIMGDAPVSN